MIRTPGRLSRPDWTDRSTRRQKIAAHRPVLHPPAAGFPASVDCPEPGNIAVFQGVASFAPFADPAGARRRPGRKSGVTFRVMRNLVTELPVPASPAPDRYRAGTAPGPLRPAGAAATGCRAFECVMKCHGPSLTRPRPPAAKLFVHIMFHIRMSSRRPRAPAAPAVSIETDTHRKFLEFFTQRPTYTTESDVALR